MCMFIASLYEKQITHAHSFPGHSQNMRMAWGQGYTQVAILANQLDIIMTNGTCISANDP